jgi:DNA-binding NtrC family response regulator
MQVLIFSKSHTDKAGPTLADWDPSNVKKVLADITQKGTVFLTTGLTFESFRKQFMDAGYIDCGEKPEKIDLNRALRFDEKGYRDQPKQLIFKSNSIGAFKRGLNAFYQKHYQASDPPCLIITSDEIMVALVRGGVKKVGRAAVMPCIDEQDPLFKLIHIPESNPLTQKLEEVYIGSSVKVKNTRAMIYLASQTASPVLILGETGTGKDVIASQIYENSTQYKQRIIKINCSALPEHLFESELFGYMKGSFTGADKDRDGLFTVADNGTIFLDEIGDLSLANQAKILHAIENKGIRPIGSSKTIPVNVRIIAATNRNLDAMMQQGTFREDLFFRLCSFQITAFPLREHPEDIPLLVKAYWKRKNRASLLTNEFLEYLQTYPWPGNVRELFALLNSLVDYFPETTLTPAHIDAIRNYRKEELFQSKSDAGNDPAQFLKIKSHSVLTTVQNILRSIKIEMRPVIHEPFSMKGSDARMEELRSFIRQQTNKLNDLCLEPSYFKGWEVFKKTARYRFLLDKTVKHWPESAEKLRFVWTEELQKLDDEINQGIMELLWGKIDM